MKTVLTLSLIGLLFACNKPKAIATTEDSIQTADKAEQMLSDGYRSGIVHETADAGCSYTIETPQLTYLLDPTNLEDTYAKEGTKVWFTFNPLRMQSRCAIASPVEILEMLPRD